MRGWVWVRPLLSRTTMEEWASRNSTESTPSATTGVISTQAHRARVSSVPKSPSGVLIWVSSSQIWSCRAPYFSTMTGGRRASTAMVSPVALCLVKSKARGGPPCAGYEG